MNPTLEQLRTLAAAAEQGSFSAAARALGKAQSVVSSAIANLEIDLGLELFDRSAHTPRLTPAGERLLVEARQLLAAAGRLRALAGELAGGIEPRLTLAVDDEAQLPWLGPVLEGFSARFPDVELELLFPLLEDLSDMLRTGRAQLGISYSSWQAGDVIVARVMGMVGMPMVVAPSHPLARCTPLLQTDLEGSRQLLVTGRRDGGERQRFRLASQVWWVEGDAQVLELVKRGLGWATIPEFLLAGPLARGEVVRLKPDFLSEPPMLQLGLHWHGARALGEAGRWLRDALLAHWPRGMWQ